MYLTTMQLALKSLMFVSGVLSGNTPPTDLSVTPIPSYVLEYGQYLLSTYPEPKGLFISDRSSTSHLAP